MDICTQCDQETKASMQDRIDLLNAENADLCKQNDILHNEVDQLNEQVELAQHEIDHLSYKIANM